MNRKLAPIAMAASFALCLALVGCGGGGGQAPSDTAENAAPATEQASSGTADSQAPAEPASSGTGSSAASSGEAAGDNHNGYFVGKWDLYVSEEVTHEQIVQVTEQYANDEAFRTQLNEAYGRDNVEFCARFAADGTGEIDTGTELVSFTWEAANEDAVTFTSFNGKETAIHVPVTDGKFTLNGDTYAKSS